MADRKISDLTALTTPATGDLLPIVDISEAAAADKNKSITVGELLRGAPDGTAAAPGFAFESDGGNGMFLGGTDILAFSTGGTQAVTIDASQRLGVGTSSPATLLHVAASGDPELRIEATGTAVSDDARLVLKTTNGEFLLQNDRSLGTSGVLTFNGASSDNLCIDHATGRVGVGTTSPNYKLHLHSATTGNSNYLQITHADAGSGVNDGLVLGLATGSSPDAYIMQKENADLIFQTNLQERLRIDSSGRVGIGTSSPAKLLEVSSSTDATIRINDPATIGSVDKYIGGIEYYTNDASGGAKVACSIKGYHVDISGQGRLQFATGAETTAMTIDGSQRVGIGTTSPDEKLHLYASTNTHVVTRAQNSSGSVYFGMRGTPAYKCIDAGDAYIYHSDNDIAILSDQASSSIKFAAGGQSESMRIDSSGRLLVGTSSARANFLNSTFSSQLQVEGTVHDNSSVSMVRNSANSGAPYFNIGKSRGTSAGSSTVVQSGDGLGVISFQGADGSEMVEAAAIMVQVDGTPGANDMPGRLVFSTTADGASSPTERMRIANGGNIRIGHFTSDIGGVENTNSGTIFYGNGGAIAIARSSTSAKIYLSQVGDVAGNMLSFARNGSVVGTISVSGSATAYNTSSDYRLKENILPVADGITRLKQLKPSRFNFIADPDTTVDGFLAHEVQTVVPEAITGEKDAVDDDGNPVYQGIDQSKLVPLLTAALQEAIGEIESLKARVAALEAN